MANDLEDLKRRLVVDHKRDGRCVYDETAKSELVELCLQPGASVSRLAREFGVNANQVSRWLREHALKRKRAALARSTPVTSPFVSVPVLAPPMASSVAARLVAPVGSAGRQAQLAGAMSLQARLPNGVTLELSCGDLRQLDEVIQALGRLTCSVSTNR